MWKKKKQKLEDNYDYSCCCLIIDFHDNYDL